MDALRHADVDAEERLTIFAEQYGNEIDAGAALADIVTAVGDFLQRIVPRDDVDAAMARLVAPVAKVAGPLASEASNWREALSQGRSACFSEWPLGERLHNLAAYAVYGVVLGASDDQSETADAIKAEIVAAEEFLASTPLSQWGLSENSDLTNLVRLASNRWALDNGAPIEPAALAVFGGVKEGRIRNLMAGSNRIFNAVDGRIPADEALPWLHARPEFWNSIWRDQRLVRKASKERPPLDGPVFVPVARDGTAFGPGLERAGRFPIGAKGREIQIEGFEAALSELQRMPVAYWRRPNAAGNWGIVEGIRWVRVDASDLEALRERPDYRIPDSHV